MNGAPTSASTASPLGAPLPETVTPRFVWFIPLLCGRVLATTHPRTSADSVNVGWSPVPHRVSAQDAARVKAGSTSIGRSLTMDRSAAPAGLRTWMEQTGGAAARSDRDGRTLGFKNRADPKGASSFSVTMGASGAVYAANGPAATSLVSLAWAKPAVQRTMTKATERALMHLPPSSGWMLRWYLYPEPCGSRQIHYEPLVQSRHLAEVRTTLR